MLNGASGIPPCLEAVTVRTALGDDYEFQEGTRLIKASIVQLVSVIAGVYRMELHELYIVKNLSSVGRIGQVL